MLNLYYVCMFINNVYILFNDQRQRFCESGRIVALSRCRS